MRARDCVYVCACVCGLPGKHKNHRSNNPTDLLKDGRTWMDGRTDGQTDRQTGKDGQKEQKASVSLITLICI